GARRGSAGRVLKPTSARTSCASRPRRSAPSSGKGPGPTPPLTSPGPLLGGRSVSKELPRGGIEGGAGGRGPAGLNGLASPHLAPEVASPHLAPEVASPHLAPEVASPHLAPETGPRSLGPEGAAVCGVWANTPVC